MKGQDGSYQQFNALVTKQKNHISPLIVLVLPFGFSPKNNFPKFIHTQKLFATKQRTGQCLSKTYLWAVYNWMIGNKCGNFLPLEKKLLEESGKQFI
jgi:hypothetical protein